jgi:hypothetical protein
MRTPVQIEARLEQLDAAIEMAFKDLDDAEYEYHETKASLELWMAKSRIKLMTGDERMTVQQREDTALIENEELVLRMATSEARVRGARANITRLRTQVDIARSMNAGMRAAMEM